MRSYWGDGRWFGGGDDALECVRFCSPPLKAGRIGVRGGLYARDKKVAVLQGTYLAVFIRGNGYGPNLPG